MSSDKNAPAKTVEEIRKERTLGIALGEGIKLGALGAFVGTIGSLYGTYRVPQFNKVTSISVRTSFPMMMVCICVSSYFLYNCSFTVLF